MLAGAKPSIRVSAQRGCCSPLAKRRLLTTIALLQTLLVSAGLTQGVPSLQDILQQVQALAPRCAPCFPPSPSPPLTGCCLHCFRMAHLLSIVQPMIPTVSLVSTGYRLSHGSVSDRVTSTLVQHRNTNADSGRKLLLLPLLLSHRLCGHSRGTAGKCFRLHISPFCSPMCTLNKIIPCRYLALCWTGKGLALLVSLASVSPLLAL